MNVNGHTTGQQGGRPRPASIRDVAAAAGVSYQTVSRVINEHPTVKPSTRELVLATIEELGFRPNRAARALAGGPVESVTVLTSNTTLYGYAAALQGIEEAARGAGFAVGVRVVDSDAEDVVTDAVARAVEPGSALIVLAFDRAGTSVLAAVPHGVPMVAAVETPVGTEGEGQPWVWMDDREAARNATRYLLGLGHETVHYVGIPSSTDNSQRTAGWLQASRYRAQYSSKSATSLSGTAWRRRLRPLGRHHSSGKLQTSSSSTSGPQSCPAQSAPAQAGSRP